MTWTLQTKEAEVEQMPTADHLRKRLLQIHEEAQLHPIIGLLHAPDGSCLAIGLGRNHSALDYTEPSGWPARHVIGDPAAEGFVDFMCLGHFSEFPESATVPVLDAVDAAVTLFNTNRLPDSLRWEDD